MKYLLLALALLQATLALNVPNCSSLAPVMLKFSLINGTLDNSTTASICHDTTSLFINWTSIDKEIISTYKNCNDPLYKEDVVEVFISTLDSYPHNYFEIEVSPSSQLFFADITNPYGNCSSLGTQYFKCDLAKYKSQRTARGWDAQFQVKLDVIGRGKAETKYKINLFRVDYSSKEPTKYLTWQPTFASPACFHKPAYFQEIILV